MAQTMKMSLIFNKEYAIGIFIKNSNDANPAKIYYAELWGSRENKYNILNNKYISTTSWITASAGICLFTFSLQQILISVWNLIDYIKLRNTFERTLLGPNRIEIILQLPLTSEEASERIADFVNPLLSDDELRQRYSLETIVIGR